ncbi:MAG: FAD-binding protein [Coriobacteriales bacterium]|jgi:fumarate reductase flavoprotein subunit|nr:FAD-binding protein [Coriobacteriales bacterium]
MERNASLNVSRRGFFKVAASGVGAAALSAIIPSVARASEGIPVPEKGGETYPKTQDATAEPMPPVGAPETWDHEADLVIVGGGGAGLSALVTCAQAGKRAVLVEKNPFTGGDTSLAIVFAGTIGDSFQLSMGMPSLSLEERFWSDDNAALSPNVQSGRNAVLTRKLLAAQAEACEWLAECGVKYSRQAAGGLPPGAAHMPTCPDLEEGDWYYWHPNTARGFTEALYQTSLELENATVLTEHPAYALVQEGDAVVGVACRDFSGNDVFVKGRRVLLCTGGFASNRAMLDKYYPGDAVRAVRSWGMPSAMGEGIRMAQGVGAATVNMHEIELWDGGAKRELGAFGVYTAANQLVRQKSLSVNKLAKRYFTESRYAGYLFSYQAAMNIHQPDATSFTLFDADCIRKEDLIERFMPVFCEYPVPWFDKQFEESLADGTIMKADTIQDLAALMEVDAPQLQKTVDRYNELCEKGYDEDFFKEPPFMVPILTPPFYAVKQVGASAFNTWGGLVADEDFHVTDAEGHAIPGLFVAGETGSLLASVGFALTGGRLAARRAIEEIFE